jgi:urocanate hydratase
VLTSDPGMGVARHADAGYAAAVAFGRRHGVDLPMA